MKVCFIRSPKQRSAVLTDLMGRLSRRGLTVSEWIPDRSVQDLDLVPRYDLYVLKSRTPLAVSLAGVLHHRGARLLNPYPSCVRLLDKCVVTAVLRDAGIPAPRSWATMDPSLCMPIATADPRPLVVKPYNGIHSRSITVARAAQDLARPPAGGEPVLVQEFVDGCTERLKIHCVGERVFATRKPFSLGGTHTPGRPTKISDQVRAMAVACGRLLGLGLFGMDVLESADGPVVVDVNSFPGYRGVPGAAQAVAEYIEGIARDRVTLPLDTGRIEAQHRS
ncbi:MAG: ATP-grasp domain-containing protein [Candidatus Eisenbacteria bacterium]|uniref:ATP-grasp domain-containing protein n=1 Tax=Eiseniibacteriota bacterium TaxID=2212470 RepID=A0A538UCU9_UNCEI|nr:MAG: ATP-grasp domain-containing protein [Candidatus Eisenbacteria bacterium]